MSASLNRFAGLSQNPRIGDDDWTISVAAELATWKVTYQAAQQMDVPPAFADVHAVYLERLGYIASAGDDIATGLDTFDVTLLNQAAASLTLGTERITEANRLLTELRDQRGL